MVAKEKKGKIVIVDDSLYEAEILQKELTKYLDG